MDSIKSSTPKCRHEIFHAERVLNPNDNTPNQECSLCTPLLVPAEARHVIGRNKEGKFVNLAAE